MGIDALRAEYHREVIGEGLLKVLRDLTWSVTRQYDPRVYGGAPSWHEVHEDILHSFVADVLLEQGQLEYALFVADTEEHFTNILARQLRFFLARQRQRTVTDNLLDRCKKITQVAPFQQTIGRGVWWYELQGASTLRGSPSQEQLARIAGELAVLPIQASSGSDRASQIYNTQDLTSLLRRVATATNCRVSVRDLDQIFHRLLTPWLPSFLEPDEGVLDVQAAVSLNAEQEEMARQAFIGVQTASSQLELGILAMKIAEVPDAAIAQHYGLSRPTISKYKKSVLAKVEAELRGLDEAIQRRAIEMLGNRAQGGGDEA